MEKKICSKCKKEKEVCEFYKSSKNPNLYRTQCKKCMNKSSNNNYVLNSKEILSKQKIKRDSNPEINKNKCRLYKEKNPDYFRNWVEGNKNHRKEYIRNYNSSPKNKLKNSLRSRVNELMNKKYENPKTFDLLGCEFSEFLSHIENKFKDGMSWDNYGYYGWHIDHIVPLSSAKTEDDLKKLYHFTNLQPLWWKDNLKKGNKIITNSPSSNVFHSGEISHVQQELIITDHP